MKKVKILKRKNNYRNIKIKRGEPLLVKDSGLFLKGKIKNKHKRYNCFKINTNFCLKLLLPLFIILLVVFIILRKNINISRRKLKINEKDNYFACFIGIGRQENKYLRELIDYYSKLGVERFILGDNNINNTEKFSDVIQDYVDSDLVEIIELFGSSMGQAELYQITYDRYRNKCKWFLLFDLDEYLVVHFEKDKSLTLKEFLPNETFNKCEAIEFNWVIYGDNELIHYDKRPLVERFTEPYFEDKANSYVKSILRGGLNKTVFVPKKSNHVPERGVTICDSKGNILNSYNPFIHNPPIFDYGYLKHFTTKTAEEYCEKIIRGQPTNLGYDPAERVQCFFSHNRFSEEKLKVFESKFNRTFNPISNRNDFRGKL